MGTTTVNKLGALPLIVDPIQAIVFFALEPGSVLIDRADSTDAVAVVTALASNSAPAHLSAFVVPLGLALSLFGLWVVEGNVRDSEGGNVLTRFGFLMLTITNSGWILTQGLTHTMANSALDSQQGFTVAASAYVVDSGFTMILGLAAALGFLSFSLGLAAANQVNRIASWVTAAFSILSLVCLIVGITDPAQMKVMLRIARSIYIVWVIWMVLLGAQTLKRGATA